MKQLELFKDCTKPPAHVLADAQKWYLFIDGASRKNPGIAGAGFCLRKNDEVIKKKSIYLKTKTNNQAEYLGLLFGLFYAKKLVESHDLLYIMSDSELLTKQMRGEYKVRDQQLAKMFSVAHLLLAGINYAFCHIAREYNEEADALANEGIDKKKEVPAEFMKLLNTYAIAL